MVYRVRTGPYETKDEAERNKEKWKKPDSRRRWYGCSANFSSPGTFERAPNPTVHNMESKRMNMNRRDFSLAAAALAAGPTAILDALSAHAQAAKPQAGRDYQVLDQSAAVEAPAGKIEVVEFFSHMCPHCNAFEPTISAWMKSVPKRGRAPGAGAFLPNAEVLQRTYYALEALNLLEKLRQHLCGRTQ